MDPFITLVSGLPRAGTSLMMQMLAAGGMPILTDGIRKPDPDNPRGYFEFEPVKRTRTDATWLPRARGKAVKLIYALLPDLPQDFEYRVILMHRDLREVVASQRAMLQRSGNQGADISDDRMAAIFKDEMQSVRAWLSQQPAFATLDVEHRDCLNTPVLTAARVNRFLGGGLNEAAMALAVDPALHRQAY
ncbi:MAG: sulfotransferase [Acidobacteriota bacterium]|nr:sulfotransferase [Acidobacteriota bacterium]